ncbi:3-oxoacyl-[acyl-carrier-protein] reductase FabG [mine drainage metagenome]|uniref:3-oxoacyl-[acyl-carrier-protein] reductase FabG n=1 Tax=mine drainage metagenome TaxID=410659 RepID=A0A1J5RKV6_9ZZZZ
MARIVVFGASGAIGGALCQWFSARQWEVLAVSRSGRPTQTDETGARWFAVDPETEGYAEALTALPGPIDAVIWAQGKNAADQVRSFDAELHRSLYEANVVYILKTLQALLVQEKLTQPSRLCLISSIWQDIARQNKLSYCVSKSALVGLVQSLVADLGPEGHLINAILPGALDTPMTRANLAPEQLAGLEAATPLRRLPSLNDVCSLAEFFCSSANSGITGQFVAADKGFSHVRYL